jgi:hypothetical protein
MQIMMDLYIAPEEVAPTMDRESIELEVVLA